VALERKGDRERPKVTVRSEDPFATPVADRRMDRRLRARLVTPVTVWTAGLPSERAGLTVSSILVAEGDPALLLGLVDPLSDLHDILVEQGRFVVHVLEAGDRRLAEVFSGAYPVDPFEEVATTAGGFGPVISGHRHIVGCELVKSEEAGFQALIVARIATIELAEATPLVRYRGQYRTLSQER
jgi:flavin reductase (DIM6/NTAB) family NADH-FMN oxidoreductase RutF